jgi:hypothetical protein
VRSTPADRRTGEDAGRQGDRAREQPDSRYLKLTVSHDAIWRSDQDPVLRGRPHCLADTLVSPRQHCGAFGLRRSARPVASLFPDVRIRDFGFLLLLADAIREAVSGEHYEDRNDSYGDP